MELKQQIKPAPKEPVSFGSLTLSSATCPEIKNLKLGVNQKMEITVEVTSLRKPDRWEISEGNHKPTDVLASVKITSISCKGDDKDDKK